MKVFKSIYQVRIPEKICLRFLNGSTSSRKFLFIFKIYFLLNYSGAVSSYTVYSRATSGFFLKNKRKLLSELRISWRKIVILQHFLIKVPKNSSHLCKHQLKFVTSIIVYSNFTRWRVGYIYFKMQKYNFHSWYEITN